VRRETLLEEGAAFDRGHRAGNFNLPNGIVQGYV
jgi:hypothetical protein